MMKSDEIERAARRLDEAERSRTQVRMFSQDYPSMTIADAYAVQAAWVKLKVSAGRRIIGHKIGLTSRAMQQAIGIDEPDSGVLFDDMVFPDAGVVPTSRFIGTRIEAELAFVMKRDIAGADRSMLDVLEATDYVVPALEILDTRLQRLDPATKATRTIVDTIADNAGNAGIVMGGRPMRPGDLDMRWVGAIVSRNAAIEETGLAAGVLNHPAMGIVWLLRRMAANGGGLSAGQVVLSGSFIRPLDVWKGDTIHADYGPMGTVSCYFK
jgi:2-oxo-hept-3-ene-1,7-dioate hydratase